MSLRTWFKRGKHAEASPETEVSGEKKSTPAWSSSTKWWKAATAALALWVACERPAHAQFDLGAILAALEQMQHLMQKAIAAPLQIMNQVEKQMASYEQQVIYPVQQIQQARQSVTQLEQQSHSVTGLFHLNLSSATLPQSQSLEALLLSRNAGNAGSVSNPFQTVYGPVMGPTAAPASVRAMTDMTDAQAQDAMKRAIQIDALSDAELGEADKIGQELSTAAPGSAPILEAEADAWVVRANAYTQSALAELMRTQAIDIANQSGRIKMGAQHNTGNDSLITSTLNR